MCACSSSSKNKNLLNVPPKCNEQLNGINIDQPYYGCCTFMERFRHFLVVTFPTRAFYTKPSIEHSHGIIKAYRHKRLKECLSVDELWHHQYINHSHVHPFSGEPYHFFTRWPNQVLVNTLIAAGMISFNKSYAGIAFWQCFHQSYQTYVYWNHRRPGACISDTQLFDGYLLGSVGAMSTALGLKYASQRYLKKVSANAGRFIPLSAVLVGAFLSIPVIRSQELRYGVPVYDHLDRRLGTSVLAAQYDVTHDIIVQSAIMTLPLLLTPMLITHFRQDNIYWICRFPHLRNLILLAMLGTLFTMSIPVSLAIYPCSNSMPYCDLEEPLRYKMHERFGNDVPFVVFYKSDC